MDLTHAVVEAAAHFGSPPQNEAETCLWVIDPVLLALGYARTEIRPQRSDSNGQFPDYTVLPESPHTWYLEAKAWHVELQDGHAHQALNYANQNGRRWVVLSNGRVWRLYDNQVQGLAADKVVTEAKLDDAHGAQHLLAALSKEAATTGALERFAVRERLFTVVRSELTDPDSRIVKDLWRHLRGQPGLSTVSCAEIVSYFAESPVPPAPLPIIQPTPDPLPPTLPPVMDAGLSLDYLAAHSAEYTRGKKPGALFLPAGARVNLSSWVDLAVEVVQWLGQQGKLPPLPFRDPKSSTRYFLNSTPEHKRSPMKPRRVRELHFGERVVYMNLDSDGERFVIFLRAACEAVGVAPSGFRIVLKE
jgi:hypothetical protein